MKHFTSVHDLPGIEAGLREAFKVKKHPYDFQHLGKNKTMILMFFNSSLRTRLSTQKSSRKPGEHGVIMDGDKPEHLLEAVPVIGSYADIIGVRSFAGLESREYDYNEVILNQFIQYSGVPVVSMEAATRHPLQSFADLITIEEYKKTHNPKVVLTWAPHPRALPQAVPNSFVEWMRQTDYELVVTHPGGYELAPEFMGGIKVEYDQMKAFKDADFIYAKNWSSYTDYGKILSKDMNWTVSERQMAVTNGAKFMHCLPVRRNMIVTDDVIESPNSIVIPEAANRVVSAQAVLKMILESD
jgi:N-succinyl-L-ornithine transcarbamylase